VLIQRKTIQDRDATVQRFHHDLHATTQAIQDPKLLKEAAGAYTRPLLSST
jgi:hypothetical protein